MKFLNPYHISRYTLTFNICIRTKVEVDQSKAKVGQKVSTSKTSIDHTKSCLKQNEPQWGQILSEEACYYFYNPIFSRDFSSIFEISIVLMAKGQTISKANYGVLNSPKKRTLR